MCAGTPWLLLLALPAQPVDAPALELKVAPRTPALAVVITPFGKASALGTTTLLDGLAAALEARTSLALRSAEQAGVDRARLLDCPAEERLTCWARRARPDLASGARRAADAPRFLFVIQARPLDAARDRVGLMWMDLDAAARSFEARPDEPPDQREDRLFAEAVHTPPQAVGPADLEDTLARLVQDHLQAELWSRGAWGRRSRRRLGHDCEGCLLTVDDRPLAALPAGPVVLTELEPAPHHLTLSRGGRTLPGCTRTFEPAPADLDLVGCAATGRGAHTPTAVVRWSGVGLLVVGAALGAVAAERAASSPDTVCVTRGGDCAGLGLPSLGFDAGAGPSRDPDAVRGGGPAWAALAGGLGVAGASLVAGSWLAEEARWWWSPLVAAVLGGATLAAVAVAGRP